MGGLIITAVGLLWVSVSVSSYGTGAPSPRCEDMAPGHGGSAQNGPSPFKAIVKQTSLKIGEHLDIALTSESRREEFKGFLVQMRMVELGKPGTKAMGRFDTASDPHAKPLACQGQPNNAMTHNSADPKKAVLVKWIPEAPGKYKIHTTFVKDFNTYWVNQQSEQVIEVHESKDDHLHHNKMTEYEKKDLCSTMKLNKSLEPAPSNPYQIMIEPIIQGKDHHEDKHKVEQQGLMWINVTSEFATPIVKLFLQVRKSNKGQLAYGKFIIPPMSESSSRRKYYFELVNCFAGTTPNAILFVNNDPGNSISDVMVQWQAPSDETGDFEVVGSVLREEFFFDHIGEDAESRKIKVVKKASDTEKQVGQKEKGKNGGTMLTTNFEIKITLFLIALFSTF